MAEPDVSVKFGADINDLKEKVDQVFGIFGQLASRFAAMAAIVGGGAAFKKFIDETNELNGEAVKLSKMLGITGEAAGTLNTLLGDIGSSAETYTHSFLHFNRSLRQNSDEMKAMGVDIAGLRSGQKSSNEVFVESLSIFGQYKPGIDQTQAAMKLFGRSVEDVYKLQRLVNDVTQATAERLGKSREELNATLTPLQKYNANMETAAEKNRALNLVITQEGVAATRKYKEAMNDVEDVMKGISKTIGEAVMPHFTAAAEGLASLGPVIVEGVGAAIQVVITLWEELANVVGSIWQVIVAVVKQIGEAIGITFGREAPGAMEIFKNALKIVQIVILTFSAGFQQLVALIGGGLQYAISWFKTFGAVAEAILSGKGWAGVKAAWQAGVDERVAIIRDGAKRMYDIGVEWAAKADAAANANLGIATGTPMGAPKGGTKTMPIGKQGKDNEKMAAELALKRAQAEAERALEQEFLKEAQSMYDEAFKNNLMSVAQYYAAKQAIEIAGIDASLKAKRAELQDAMDAQKKAEDAAGGAAKAEERNKYEAQAIKFKTQVVKLLGQINVEEAQRLDVVRRIGAEQADAERQLQDTLSIIRATRAKANADMDISMAKEEIDQMKAMRLIDAQSAFEAQRALEDRSFAATKAFLAAKRATILNDDKKALAQQDADEEAAERAHQQKLTQIDHQAVLERAKYSLQAQQSIESGFATMVGDFLRGTKTLGDAIRGFATAVGNAFTNLIAQRFAERLFGAGTAGGKAVDALTKPLMDAIDSMVAKWIGAEAVQSAVTQTESAARTAFRTSEIAAQTAAETAGAAATTAAQQTSSIAGVMGWASTAAAAAMASVAAIPITGWEMAPGVGAATYANAMGYLATARGGFDIPGGVNPLTQLHEEEMVLPAFLANPMRKMLQAGPVSTMNEPGGKNVTSVQNHFHLGAPTDKRTQMQIAHAASQSIQRANRNN